MFQVRTSLALSRLSSSGVAPSFMSVDRASVAVGCYPKRLLQLWDDFEVRNR